MIYNIDIKAKIESNLSKKDLENQLVIALHNVDSGYSKFDGVDDSLEVLDYDFTEATKLCPHCDTELESRMVDIDGTNLVENNICPDCGYGTPALL